MGGVNYWVNAAMPGLRRISDNTMKAYGRLYTYANAPNFPKRQAKRNFNPSPHFRSKDPTQERLQAAQSLIEVTEVDLRSPVAEPCPPLLLGRLGLPFSTDTPGGLLTSLACAQCPLVLAFQFMVFFSGKKSPLSKTLHIKFSMILLES